MSLAKNQFPSPFKMDVTAPVNSFEEVHFNRNDLRSNAILNTPRDGDLSYVQTLPEFAYSGNAYDETQGLVIEWRCQENFAELIEISFYNSLIQNHVNIRCDSKVITVKPFYINGLAVVVIVGENEFRQYIFRGKHVL